jgi:hypothetical protein
VLSIDRRRPRCLQTRRKTDFSRCTVSAGAFDFAQFMRESQIDAVPFRLGLVSLGES